MNRQSARPLGTDLRHALSVALALAALGTAAPGHAFDFQSDSGLSGSLDTTFSFTDGWRVRSPDARLVGIPEGGTARNVNADNGDLNYKVGQPFTEAFKIVSEASLKYQNYGVFVRGSMLYDHLVQDGTPARTPFTTQAKALSGQYVRLLDAFAYGKWHVGEGHPVELRVGNQVLNWGETTFFGSGLNAANALDVAALRAPGAELREAFLAQPMARLTAGFSEHVSADAFYMFSWRKTELEPVGTYFSTNDFVPRGGSQQFIGFGAYSDQGVDFRPLGGSLIPNFWATPRVGDVNPPKSGQGGLALRFFLPNLGSGTEIAFYAMQYASRTPVVSSRSGSPTGIGNAIGAATAVGAAARALANGLTPAGAVALGTLAGQQAAGQAGGNISAATLQEYATIGVNTVLSGGDATAQAVQLANHEYIITNEYFAEYPDKLKTLAVSFNTQLGTSGFTLQGEVDFRQNTPLQIDGSEIVFAAGTALEQTFALAGLSGPIPGTCTSGDPTLSRCNQLGVFGPSDYIQGYGRYDVWQGSLMATKSLPPMLGARQVVLIAEAGLTYVPSLPNKTQGGPNGNGLLLAGAGGNNLPGNVAVASALGASGGAVEPLNRFADSSSWGYVMVASFEYPSLIGSWNLNPKITWQQDVKGTSPLGGNFVEGRHALGLSVNANLQNTWDLGVSYVAHGGGGQYNALRDRDFVAATLKYSF